MALKLHNLKPAKGAKSKRKRLGRGDASGSGSYSNRGMKGQRSRSGGKGGLKLLGMKANIQSMPKLSGFKSFKPKYRIVNLKDLDKFFKNGDVVNPGKLIEKKLIKNSRPGVKVLGLGKITKKITLKVDKVSDSARQAIESAGGKVYLNITHPKPKNTKKEDKKTEVKKSQATKKTKKKN